MIDLFLENESSVRLVTFLSLFTLFALLEVWIPRRHQAVDRGLRWLSNLALVVLDSLLLRLIFPAAAAGIAIYAEANGIGLVHRLDLHGVLTVIGCIFLLDGAIYGQHYVFHRVPLLWRLHRVHHTDIAYDLTTGVRFHPVEILLSMLIKGGIVLILGIPPLSVILFEIILSSTALFNHSNIHIPERVDAILRWLIVTPDMHRVHHSVYKPETDSNFGFNISIWDRLFGTYTAQPQDGHSGMEIGLNQFRSRHEQRLNRLLLQPLH